MQNVNPWEVKSDGSVAEMAPDELLAALEDHFAQPPISPLVPPVDDMEAIEDRMLVASPIYVNDLTTDDEDNDGIMEISTSGNRGAFYGRLLDQLAGANRLVRSAEDQENAMSGHVVYVKGPDTMEIATIRGNMEEGSEERLLKQAAGQAAVTMINRYLIWARQEFYLTVMLGFADGSWRTVKYAGEIDLTDYAPAGGDWTGPQIAALKSHLFTHLLRFMAMMHYKYDEDIGGGLTHYVIGIHNPDASRGGCSNSAPFKIACNFLRGDSSYSCMGISYRSRSNNCAIVCLLKFWNEVCKGSAIHEPPIPTSWSRKKKQQCQVTPLVLKKEMGWLNKNDPIGKRGLEYLANRLQMRITVKDFEGYVTLSDFNIECKRQATLLLRDGHYLLCKDLPVPGSQRNNRGVLCKTCGKEGTYRDHQCKGKKIKRFHLSQHKEIVEGDVQAFLTDFRKEDKHWMVQGPGGTGKSFLIRELTKSLECGFSGEYAVLGTTGVASLNIKGRTVNSYFCLGDLSKDVEYYFNKLLEFDARVEEIKKLRFLILEEVSMMSPQLFYMVNEILRRIKKKNIPFGGVRICMFGDFLQLPPIPKNHQDVGSFIFETELWLKMQIQGFAVLNMAKGYRYKDNPEWFELLQRVRKNNLKEEDEKALESRIFSKKAVREICRERGLKPTYIFTKNRRVNQYNKKKNDQLDGEEHPFEIIGVKKGTIPKHVYNRYNHEAGGKLILKVGSEVMYISNKLFSYGIANGSRGVVTSIVGRNVNVLFENVGSLTITYEVWEEGILHIPLILAWAITAHKCQGKSLHCVVASLGQREVFEKSQAYVVISRCRKIENLFLLKYSVSSFDINPRALHFTNWLEDWEVGKIWKKTNRSNYLDDMKFQEILTMRDSTTSCLEVQPKAQCEGNLFQNIIFYDFETYFRRVPGEEEREVPYFNYIEHYMDGLPTWKKTLCYLCDRRIDVQKQTCVEIMDRVIKSADLYNEISRTNDFCRTPHVTLCAYNGGNFDYHFLMKEILETSYSKRFIPEVTLKGTKMVSMTLFDTVGQRICLKTHDLCNIIPKTRLSTAAKDFIEKSKQVKKGYFPHDWCTAKSLSIASRSHYEQTFKIDISYFPKNEHDRIREEKVDLTRFPFHKMLHDYGPNDVYVMVELYKVFEELTQKILKTSLLRFITLSKMTWYGFLTNLESQFLRQAKKGRRKMKTLIHRTSRKVDKDMYRATYGAKCFPRFARWLSRHIGLSYDQIKDAYIYFDVKSMYVSVMMNEEFPYGLHTFHENDDYISWLNILITRGPDSLRSDKLPHLFIAYCDVEPHPYEVEPPIARHERSDSSVKSKGPLHWDNTRRTGWYNSVDLYSLMRNQGKIHKIFKAYKWEFKGKIFSNWVGETFKGKQKAAAEGQKAKKKFYKTLGNACYGSSCQAMFDDVVRHISTPDDLNRFHRDYEWQGTVNFEEVVRNEHNVLILKGRNVVREDLEFTERPRYLGGFILAYSKILYDDVYTVVNPLRRSGCLQSVKMQIPYGDTDSFLIHMSRVPALRKAGLIGLNPGQICDDLIDDELTNFAKIVELEIPGPKSYGLRAVFPEEWRQKIIDGGKYNASRNRYSYHGKCYELTPTQVILDMVKIKGIIQDNCHFTYKEKEFDYLDLDLLRKIRISTDGGEVIKVTSKGRFLRNGITRSRAERSRGDSIWKITRRNLERTFFKTKFDRRRYFDGGEYSVPHGFNENNFKMINYLLQLESGVLTDPTVFRME